MPYRYSIGANKEQLEKRFSIEITQEYHPRYNAAPSQPLPVITNTSPGYLSYFYWGVDPNWSKNKPISRKLTLIDSASIMEKISVRNVLQKNRCIVPADGFYEWKNISKKRKIPYRMIPTDGEIFSFAGIWEEYEDINDNRFATFKIITTEANEVVSELHSLMPVLLNAEQEKIWLDNNSDLETLLSNLSTYPAEKMTKFTISPLIDSVENDFPGILDPKPAADQLGNYSLFE